MKVEDKLYLDYGDVLIRPRRGAISSRALTSITREFQFSCGVSWSGFPLIAANMDTVGTFEMAQALLKEGALTSLHKFFPKEHLVEFFSTPDSENSFFTLGISDDDLEKLAAVSNVTKIRKISIDVANGYMDKFVDTVKRIREKNPSAVIMAGTVVTPEVTVELLQAGADIIRIGIGSGSVCRTRDVTGVGVPQLTAVSDCATAAHETRGYVCADGGCKTSGDVAKALGAGADFIMLGGMLAGHDECAGEWIYETVDGKEIKKALVFYGMASDTALLKRYGGVASHRTSEGATIETPYKGSVAKTIAQIKAGVRSTMSYIGVSELKEIPDNTVFVRVTK